MSGETRVYSMAVIRDLLLAAFTADDLRRLVLYTSQPALRALLNEFGPGDGLAALVEKTIVYCYKQNLVSHLLAEVKQANPRQYAHFEPHLSASGAPVPGAPSPPPATGGTTYTVHIQHAQGIAIGDGARVVTATEHDPADQADDADEPAQ